MFSTKLLGIVVLLMGIAPCCFVNANELHEYLTYRLPIDIRQTDLWTDTQLSQALASTLVKQSPTSEYVSCLADKWSIDSEGRSIEFHLDSKSLWSDGKKITASDVAHSFESARTHFGRNPPQLFQILSDVSVISDSVVRLNLARPHAAESVLAMLSDSSTGIVRLTGEKPDLKVSSGPYILIASSEQELVLKANRNWVKYTPEMIDDIYIRRPQTAVTADTLKNDSWPDYVFLGAGLTNEDLNNLPIGTKFWRLNHDRLRGLHYAGRSDLHATRALIGLLRSQQSIFRDLTQRMSDEYFATQIYPRGTPLHSSVEPKPSEIGEKEFKRQWKRKEVKIAYYSNIIPKKEFEIFSEAIRKAIPLKVEFYGVSSEVPEKVELSKAYDLFLGSFSVDPDTVDCDMSYIIETVPPRIPSDNSELGNFKSRFRNLHLSADKLDAYRKILLDAVENNYYLPISHYSTTVAIRAGVDFSHVPKLGEFMPYSAMRKSDK